MGELLPVIRSSLDTIAAVLDESSLRVPTFLGRPAAETKNYMPSWNLETPTIILDLPDIVAIMKPPHWEVDARPGGTSSDSSVGTPKLSSFLRSSYPREKFPLVHCSEQQHGIIHRLDTPSSGLILVGKDFKGYYTLRWQQDTYELGREYMVLCHGQMSWGARVINAKIRTSTNLPLLSRVSDDGKPAWTRVTPLCILLRSNGEEYTLVTIVIRTGRTHQIRVHLQHIGFPTVTDGKYTDPVIYESDKLWCPRNFLHRHRLTFQDTEGVQREAVASLPEDLLMVLRRMIPREDGFSEEVLQRVLSGWVPWPRFDG